MRISEIFNRLWRRGRDTLQRAGNAAGVTREFKDIFEINGMPAFRQFYEFGVWIWLWLYKGLYVPWHVIPATTVDNAKATRQLYRMNTPKAVCAELASLVWGEQTEIHVSMKGRAQDSAEGDETPDPLDEFVADVLDKNRFFEKMQELIEEMLALGGAAVKVWHDERRDSEGNALDGGDIRLGYCMADQFVPISWDNANIYEGVFISRRAKNGYYYTRLEYHKRSGETYIIRNELYKADMQKGAAGQNQDILGVRCPLAELYPWLEEETTIKSEDSFFSYVRTPIANNLDVNSPLGMSIYGNALETLHALDICYDSFIREFRLGKKRIVVPSRFLRAVTDPQTGVMRRYFDPSDETYVGMPDDDKQMNGVQDISVELRVEEHIGALNAFLSILCLQLGFSANTFSFDERGGLKTATEVVSENSKTYKTIKTVQNQLAPMIEHVVKNIIDVAKLYGVEWKGQKVEALAAGEYEVKVVFDDGVTQDRATNINEGVMLAGAGLLSKYKFLTDPKYGQGLTEEEAKAEIARIKQENGVTVTEDQMRMFGGVGV